MIGVTLELVSAIPLYHQIAVDNFLPDRIHLVLERCGQHLNLRVKDDIDAALGYAVFEDRTRRVTPVANRRVDFVDRLPDVLGVTGDDMPGDDVVLVSINANSVKTALSGRLKDAEARGSGDLENDIGAGVVQLERGLFAFCRIIPAPKVATFNGYARRYGSRAVLVGKHKRVYHGIHVAAYGANHGVGVDSTERDIRGGKTSDNTGEVGALFFDKINGCNCSAVVLHDGIDIDKGLIGVLIGVLAKLILKAVGYDKYHVGVLYRGVKRRFVLGGVEVGLDRPRFYPKLGGDPIHTALPGVVEGVITECSVDYVDGAFDRLPFATSSRDNKRRRKQKHQRSRQELFHGHLLCSVSIIAPPPTLSICSPSDTVSTMYSPNAAGRGGRAVLLAVFFVSFLAAVVPAIPQIPPSSSGSALLEAAETAIYTGRPGDNEREVLALLSQARQEFNGIDDPSLAAYWLARAALLEGMLYNQQDEERRAVRVLEEGLDHTVTALRGGPFSEGLRVRADLHSQMMFARGLFYMMRNGDDARDSTFAALELEPENVRAHITAAGFYLNAPSIAGGDPAEAIRLIERAIDLSPGPNERYLLYVFLAQARARIGDEQIATQALERAEAVYPGTEWVREVRRELDLD